MEGGWDEESPLRLTAGVNFHGLGPGLSRLDVRRPLGSRSVGGEIRGAARHPI